MYRWIFVFKMIDMLIPKMIGKQMSLYSDLYNICTMYNYVNICTSRIKDIQSKWLCLILWSMLCKETGFHSGQYSILLPLKVESQNFLDPVLAKP